MIYNLSAIAVALTFLMFHSRNLLLGFPATIFWAILGGHSYQQSTATWDIYYLLFFASMGMAIFSALAMYTLRDRDLAGPDADEATYFDEAREPDLRGNVEKDSTESDEAPSRRSKAIRERATQRRGRR